MIVQYGQGNYKLYRDGVLIVDSTGVFGRSEVQQICPASPTPPTPAPAPTESPGVGSVVGFTLINAATDTDLRAISDGDVIDLAVDGSYLTIRADVSTSENEIGSMRFDLGTATSFVFNFKTENFAPYALGGDNQSGNYGAVSQLGSTGSYALTATPFSGSNRSGVQGSPETINFTVI